MVWILVSILAALVILGIVALFAIRKVKKHGGKNETDYYTFFLMGLIWLVIGGAMMLANGFEFNALFSMGLIFFIVGLANRDKWKQKKKIPPIQEKMKILLTVLMSISVVAGVAAYMYVGQPVALGELVMIGTILAIVVFAIAIGFRRFKSLRAGLPAEDEMSKRVTHKAGYYSFIAAIWVTLGLSWGNVLWTEDYGGVGLSIGEFAAGIIIATGLVFVLSFFYINKSGKVD